jgi:hypothetical protein
MKGSLAWAAALCLAFGAEVTGPSIAVAQMGGPSQCNEFVKIKAEADKNGIAVRSANERHAERKEVCVLMTRFAASEGALVKFLEDNKTWCAVPDQVIKVVHANHDKTLKFRTAVCTEAPESHPKVPTLSDAITTPSVDTSKNTKTGRGTFDTLNGNPLAR